MFGHHTEESKRKISENNGRYWLGRHHSEETKRKISESTKNPSEETRKKMSEANKGRVVSTETRLKMSRSQKDRQVSPETGLKISKAKKGKPSHLKGKTLPEETKKKMSEAGLKHSAEITQRLKEQWKDEDYRKDN